MYIYIYIYIYIFMQRGREIERPSEREREGEKPGRRAGAVRLVASWLGVGYELEWAAAACWAHEPGPRDWQCWACNACRRCAMDGVSVFLGRPGEPGAGGIAMSVSLASRAGRAGAVQWAAARHHDYAEPAPMVTDILRCDSEPLSSCCDGLRRPARHDVSVAASAAGIAGGRPGDSEPGLGPPRPGPPQAHRLVPIGL